MIHGAKGMIRRTYHLIPAMAATLPEQEIEKIKKDKKVAYLEEDAIVMATALLSGDEYVDSWGVVHIGADAAHASGNKGTGVKVAVIDSGIDYTHEDLDSNYRGGYDFVFNDNDPFDDNLQSHGTHVAGIIAAEQNDTGVIGVAPEAEIYAVKVLDGGGFGLASWVIAALEWAVDNGMDIANLSLEGPDVQSLHQACDSAVNAGLLVIAAGGNTSGGSVRYPAAYDSVISVTGIDAFDMKASFSPVGPEVELAAPGVAILSTVVGSNYSTLSGTSQAAPHVAGTAALFYAAGLQDGNGNGMINDEARALLRLTAVDLGDPGFDNIYGFGRINAAAAAFSNAPPVGQQIGRDDGIFNNLSEWDCRFCHDNPGTPGIDPAPNVDRHHLKVKQFVQTGVCSVNGNACVSDAMCNAGICEISGDPCSVDNNCPGSGEGETCGEVCIGETVAPNPLANPTGRYECLSCHNQDTSGGIISFIVTRDCLQCHIQVPGEASVHHLTAAAQGLNSPVGDPLVGDCTPCHGTLVDDIGDGHDIPTYAPSLVTPSPSGGTGQPLNENGNGAGACDYCHDAGIDLVSGIQVFPNQDTHHNTGVFISETGAINSDKCFWCHRIGYPSGDAYDIRTCEGCHGYEALHNIAVDSDSGCFSDPPSCEVDVGNEAPGYSHVGSNNDCWGCHGFTATSDAPAAGPITPYISGISTSVITAGSDTQVTLSGAAFTNIIGEFQWKSDVVLTNMDSGSWIVLTPESITQSTLTVTIPGTTAPGNYTLRALKGSSSASNPVAISIKPAVQITGVACNKCTGNLTISGSGFGAAPPEGAQEYLNVAMDGNVLDITSWTDTEIKASGAGCGGTVTINALFGSAAWQQ